MKRILSFGLVLVILTLTVLGCGTANQSARKDVQSQSSERAEPTIPSAASNLAKQPTTAGSGSDTSSAPSQSIFQADRMVIYDATLSLIIQNTSESIEAVTQIARDAGGYVASTSSKYDRELPVATMTLKIPARAYDDVMSKLRASSTRVKQEDSKTQDVTEEYSDLQAQLRNLEATEAQYLELLKRAQTIDEILKVQQKLTDTRNQIERIKGRVTYLDRRTEMATITVSLMPESLEKSKITSWEPLRVASDAWAASLEFLAGVANIAIAAAVFFWWLIAFFALVLFLLRNRLTARRKKEIAN